MSLSQYKRVQSIAEALQRKVDLPDDTINKYQDIRDSILRDSGNSDQKTSRSTKAHIEEINGTSREELGNAIREEVIIIQSMFIETILDDYKETLAKKGTGTPADGQPTSEYDNQAAMQKRQFFLDKLVTTKNEMKNIVDDMPCTELKYVNKKWLDEIDNLEMNFMKHMEQVENIEETYFENLRTKDAYEFQLDHIKVSVEQQMSQISNLEVEKKKLLEKITEEGLEIPKITEDDIAFMENLKKQVNIMKAENEDQVEMNKKHEWFTNCFMETFYNYGDKYSSGDNFDMSNRDQVVLFVKDLFNKMEEDNRWLLDKIEEYENVNDEVRMRYDDSEMRFRDLTEEVRVGVEYTMAEKDKVDKLKMQIRDFMERNLEVLPGLNYNEC